MSVGESQRLTVTCPNCGKTGKLPVGVTTFPKTVKCSGCQTKFNPGTAALEQVALDAVGVKEPEIYDLEKPDSQPMNWAPTPVVVRPCRYSRSSLETITSPPVPVSESNPQVNRPAEKSYRRWWILLAFALFGFLFVLVITTPEDQTTEDQTVTAYVDYDETVKNLFNDLRDPYLLRKSLKISEEVYEIAQWKRYVSKIHVVVHASLTSVDSYGHESRSTCDLGLRDYDASEVRKYGNAEYFNDRQGVQADLHFGAIKAFPALKRSAMGY
jgi:hypothetical protein